MEKQMNKEISIRKTKRKEITFEKSVDFDFFVMTVWKDDSESTSIILNKENVQNMMDFINKNSK
tara:strand:+ start:127 stop:318 length:192 start_codon:yes stop_codon:yes gene_type:complete